MLQAYVRLRNWWMRQEGANMVEYILIAALVAAAVMATVGTLGQTVKNVLVEITNTIKR